MALTRDPERRGAERRASRGLLSERAMRCECCHTVWFSAVAEVAAAWARCPHCGASLHTERRSGADRRDRR